LCGIVGITAEKPFSVKGELILALKKLEYRGYDSAGFATTEGVYDKEVGSIDVLESRINPKLKTTTGIAHTRWATHGGVTRVNAHPHFDSEKGLFIVHNGIIENYAQLKAQLEERGYKFITKTDTEVIVNYLHEKMKTMSPRQAILSFFKDAKGTYAVVFFRKGEKTLYAFKKDSPLCLGICDGEMILASDIYAFSHKTTRTVFFEDYELAEVTPNNYQFYNRSGKLDKKPVEIEWEREPVMKRRFKHFMLKEIYEQPVAAQRLIRSLRTTQSHRVKQISKMIKGAKRILFLACGTSYHASLIGAYLLSRLGYEAHAVIASEFENFSVIDNKTLVFAVSQSGETMDVISVLKDIKHYKPKIVAIVNYPYSTVHRMADNYIEIMAGQEICVAATKTFTNTLIAMYELARVLGNHISLDRIPAKIKEVISKNDLRVRKLAKKLSNNKDIFVLGHRISYPIAREVALKLKEISYIHAEGMMAGELKHGTIALVEPGVPVIGLIHETNRERMESALQEVEAHGADVYTIGNSSKQFELPKRLNEEEYSIAATIIGHLLSYYIARNNNLPIDKPRNLAKSVTVK